MKLKGLMLRKTCGHWPYNVNMLMWHLPLGVYDIGKCYKQKCQCQPRENSRNSLRDILFFFLNQDSFSYNVALKTFIWAISMSEPSILFLKHLWDVVWNLHPMKTNANCKGSRNETCTWECSLLSVIALGGLHCSVVKILLGLSENINNEKVIHR